MDFGSCSRNVNSHCSPCRTLQAAHWPIKPIAVWPVKIGCMISAEVMSTVGEECNSSPFQGI